MAALSMKPIFKAHRIIFLLLLWVVPLGAASPLAGRDRNESSGSPQTTTPQASSGASRKGAKKEVGTNAEKGAESVPSQPNQTSPPGGQAGKRCQQSSAPGSLGKR